MEIWYTSGVISIDSKTEPGVFVITRKFSSELFAAAVSGPVDFPGDFFLAIHNISFIWLPHMCTFKGLVVRPDYNPTGNPLGSL